MMFNMSCVMIFSSVICGVFKQNESEVGSDMLLVSDDFYTSNIMSVGFETRHL